MTVDISCIANGWPSDLFGCLDSYAANARMHGRIPNFTVIDPTSDAVRRNASKEAAARFHRTNKTDVEYISNREMDIFIARASKYSWVDTDSLRYALVGDNQIGSDHGAACNAAMLAAGSVKSLVVSASTRCEVAGSPGSKDDLRVHPGQVVKFGPLHGDVEPVSFFGSIDDAGSKLAILRDEDILREVDRVLGQCHSECSTSFQVCHGQPGDERIGAVSLDTWGDVGVDSAGFYLLSRQVIAVGADDGAYAQNRFNRNVHRASRDWAVGSAVNLRPVAFGLCPSAHVVPFLPTESVRGGFAGQSLFGMLLRRQASPQVSMTIPLAVKNSPGGAQVFSSHDIAEMIRRISFTDFLSVMIGAMGSATSLRDIGVRLEEVTSDRSFLALTVAAWGRYIVDSVATRNEYGVESAMMRADLTSMAYAGARILENQHIRSQGRQRFFEDYLAPYEFRIGPHAEHVGEVLSRQISQFGKLLVAWPGLVAAVADLGKNGVRLGAYI